MYERLLEYYHTCGRIRHCSWDCKYEKAKEAIKRNPNTGYGSWIKATQGERNKSKMEKVKVGDIGRGRRYENPECEGKTGNLEAGKSSPREQVRKLNSRKILPTWDSESEATNTPPETSTAAIRNKAQDKSGIVVRSQTTREEVSEIPVEVNQKSMGMGVKRSLEELKMDEPSPESMSITLNALEPIMEAGDSTTPESYPVGESIDMSSSPCKKTKKKWKRAARGRVAPGAVSSPIRKMLVAQQGRRKSSRGSSLSPSSNQKTKGTYRHKSLPSFVNKKKED